MSMMVTLELVKVIQAKLMEWDQQMMLDKNDPDSGMKAKTSNLNDELALVNVSFILLIFSRFTIFSLIRQERSRKTK